MAAISKAARIRELSASGLSSSEMALIVGVSVEHVANVLWVMRNAEQRRAYERDRKRVGSAHLKNAAYARVYKQAKSAGMTMEAARAAGRAAYARVVRATKP